MARSVVSSGKLKRRRRNRRLLAGGGAAVVLALAVAGLAWLSHAPFVRATNIEVTGAKSLPAQAVQAYVWEQLAGNYAGLFARNNIFLYPRAAIAAGLLAKYPTLRSVDVHAKDFHGIEVVLAEREPAGLWCPLQGPCSYMDETGLVYAPAPQYSDSPYVAYSGPVATTSQPGLQQYLTAQQFQSLSALVAALEVKEPGDPIGRVAVDDSGDVRAYFRDDFVLIFALDDDGGDVFDRFTLALGSDAFAGKQLSDFEYLDLRFGDKLYYKAKSASN